MAALNVWSVAGAEDGTTADCGRVILFGEAITRQLMDGKQRTRRLAAALQEDPNTAEQRSVRSITTLHVDGGSVSLDCPTVLC